MNREALTIRRENPGDVPAIRQILQESFPGGKEADLVDRLRLANRLSISLVTWMGNRPIGHVAFSPVTVADNNSGLGLAPVAVDPAFRRQGFAASLIREGLSLCQKAGVPFVVVLGEPAYYGRFGFKPATNWNLSDEYGGGPAFQALELSTGGIPPSGGLVRYAPDFAIFLD